jgi:hypothetical protein
MNGLVISMILCGFVVFGKGCFGMQPGILSAQIKKIRTVLDHAPGEVRANMKIYDDNTSNFRAYLIDPQTSKILVDLGNSFIWRDVIRDQIMVTNSDDNENLVGKTNCLYVCECAAGIIEYRVGRVSIVACNSGVKLLYVHESQNPKPA